jgi:membrane protease YdiL (CAAX protease family)
LVTPGLAWGAASAVAAALGAEPPAFDPLVPALISGLLAGMLEEFGWSGLAFPTPQARYGFVRAGVAVGCIVAVWHLPFLRPGRSSPGRRPGLPADADPGKDHLRLDLQRVGRQHPVDGVVPRLGQRLVRGLGQGPAVADAAALTVMLAFWVVAIGVLRKQPVGVSGRLLVTLLGSR